MSTLLIKNGRIMDPVNKTDRVANLFVRDGKIVSVTEEEPAADTVVDASGKLVTPGFIDIHMHESAIPEGSDQVPPYIERSMLLMGVTSCFGGNCGDAYGDPAELLDFYDEHGCYINMGLFAGHSYIRSKCGGTDKYAPVSAEVLEAMKKQAQAYLDAGCMGISFGVKYIPGTTWEEMVELSKLVVPSGRLVTAHIRNDCVNDMDAIDELRRLSEDTGCRVEVSHIGSMAAYGHMDEFLRHYDDARAAGVDMQADCYPYNAFSTAIGATTFDDYSLKNYNYNYGAIQIVDGENAGKRCTKEIFDWERANHPEHLCIGFFMNPDEIVMAMTHEGVMLGSDGLRAGLQGHPRAAGAFPRLISEYVKTGKVTLEHALEMMISMPRERLGLENKGVFNAGADADILIWDYDRMKDMATFDEPNLGAEGIDYVFIGGEIAAKDGEVVNSKLGRSIRFKEKK
ncbi:MAG: amidohydrolase family protein [Clostridia bacterium]|nr:amidohydrolase family protein [Clostridia bacterium]